MQQTDKDSKDDDAAHKKEIKRKLEEKMERLRLKHELEDYDGELDEDFDWEEIDKP